MRKPRSIAVLAMVGLGLFGAIGLNAAPSAQAQSSEVLGQPLPDDGCPQVPGAPKDFCPPPPPPPGGGCTSTSAAGCPEEDPCTDIRLCPPPPECECETTTTTTVGKKVPPGVSWNPTYTG